jgi:hypothetical protein
MRVNPTGVGRKREIITLMDNVTWNPTTQGDIILDIPTVAIGRVKFLEIKGVVAGAGRLRALVYYQQLVAPDNWLILKYYSLVMRLGFWHIYAIEPHSVPARLYIEFIDTNYTIENLSISLLL